MRFLQGALWGFFTRHHHGFRVEWLQGSEVLRGRHVLNLSHGCTYEPMPSSLGFKLLGSGFKAPICPSPGCGASSSSRNCSRPEATGSRRLLSNRPLVNRQTGGRNRPQHPPGQILVIALHLVRGCRGGDRACGALALQAQCLSQRKRSHQHGYRSCVVRCKQQDNQ